MDCRREKLFLILLVGLFACGVIFGSPTNGNFSSGLTGWTISPPSPKEAVVAYNDAAVLLNPGDFSLGRPASFPNSFSFLDDYPQPVGGNVAASTLSQSFMLSPDAHWLSFDMDMEIYRLTISETDIFTASINGSTQYSITSAIVGGFADGTPGFTRETVEHIIPGETLKIVETHELYHTTVSIDVSSWAGSNIDLAFALQNNFEMGDPWTTVTLDNVEVTSDLVVIPAPPAVLLGLIGMLGVGCFRGKRSI